MRLQEILLEYITYDNNKFLSKYQAEGNPFENQIGSTGENFTDWLEQYDPSNGNKYVNWMIIRYLKNDINRLEDIPSRISPALKKYMGLQNKKKLKPEHKDLNKIRNLEDVIDEYQDEDVTSKSEKKDKYLTSGDAELVYEDSSYRIIIPKTEEASCYFGVNTRWCTAAKEGNMFDYYKVKGPLYIILHKPSNTRWQFQFETEQYMNEKDEQINLIEFFKEHKKVFGVFKKLGYVDYNNGSWKLGDKYYNDKMQFHREDGPAAIYSDGRKEWWVNNKRHREDGPAYIDADGRQVWFKNGKLHREDGPAAIYPDGSKEWYKNGKLHRDDGPAYIDEYGNQRWYLNGENHREDGPAVIGVTGTKFWYLNDKLHREDGPAVIYPDGTKEWYKNGERHRDDGPAVIDPDGTQVWRINGNLHREDGPAYIYPDGTTSWYVNGKYINNEVNQWAEDNNIELDNLQSREQEQLTKFIKSLA